jgi:hypothetical protein
MDEHKIGDLMFDPDLGLGEIIEYKDEEEHHPRMYRVRWSHPYTEFHGELVLTEGEIVMEKNRLVRIMERYTTGGVGEICRWERERHKAQGAV